MKPARATRISFRGDLFVRDLEDGRQLSVPLSWYPRLRAAGDDVRGEYDLFTVADVQFVRWRALNITLSVDGLLVTSGPITPWDFGDDDSRDDGTL